MTVTTPNTVKAARLDAISTVWGTNPKLVLYTTPIPADVNATVSGTVLVTVTITPAAASGNTKDMLGGAKVGTASNTGNAAYYRVWNTGLTTAFEQGTVGTSGTDLVIDNVSINNAQTVNFNTWTKTEP